MRHIKKMEAPGDYIDWIRDYRKDNKRSPDFLSIPPRYKEKIKHQFIKEQKGLCCYCCGRITNETSHIEHFYPQSLCKTHYRKKQTDCSNMFVSCNGYIKPLDGSVGDFCGHHKLDWYDEGKMISPLDEDCAKYFTYSLQGKIRAKDENEKALEMIKHLGLDDYVLNEARKNALEAIGYFEENYDENIGKKLVTQLDEEGNLPPFTNIIEYFVYIS